MKRVFILSITSLLQLYCCMSAIADFRPNQTKETLTSQSLTAEKPVILTMNAQLPEGYEINQEAPSQILIQGDDNKVLLKSPIKNRSESFIIERVANATKLTVDVAYYYCKKVGASVCLIKSYLYSIPIELTKDGSNSLTLSPLLPPEQPH